MSEQKVGKVIIPPKHKVEDIEIEFDKDSTVVNGMIESWGQSIPVIKFNNKVIDSSSIVRFSLSLKLYNLPTFSFTIEDYNGQFQESLRVNYESKENPEESEQDQCVIFFGYKTFYFKFNGLITNVSNTAKSNNITISGIWYNKKLYEQESFIYKEKTINEILKDICTKCELGLYVVDNEELNEKIPLIINPGRSYLNFLRTIIEKYTTCLYMFDTHGYVHIGRFEELRNEPQAKFTLTSSGDIIKPTPMLLTNRDEAEMDSDKAEKNSEGKKIEKYLMFNSYGHSTDFSGKHFSLPSKQVVIGPGKTTDKDNESTILEETPKFGIGTIVTNTFKPFIKYTKPYHQNTINKQIAGNSTQIITNYLIFELNPFDIIDTEFYTEQTSTAVRTKDKLHSGKKMLKDFNFKFSKSTQFDEDGNILPPKIIQTINLI